MKKTVYILSLLGATLFCASCEEEGKLMEMDPNCAYATFPSSSTSRELDDANVFSIELWRGNTAEAGSVEVVIENDSEGLIKEKTQILEFAKGEAKSKLEFTYNVNDLPFGVNYNISVAIKDETQVSPSGADAIAIKVTRKMTRVSLGEGIWYSDGYEAEWDQEICTTEEDPNFYIFPNCWVRGGDFSFRMVNGEPVWGDVIETGDDWGYGPIVLNVLGCTIEDGIMVLEVEYYEPSDDYSYGEGIETFTFPEGFSF